MRSSLARRFFTTTLTIAIISSLTSGFTLHRKDSPNPVIADQTTLESVQLQVKDISKRPNDINDDKYEFNSKAATVAAISNSEADHSHEKLNANAMAITEINLPSYIENATAQNVNINEATPDSLKTSRDTEEKSTVTISTISQIIQSVTNPSSEEDIHKVTTKEVPTSNTHRMTTGSETNVDLIPRKDSTSSESKTDMTTDTSEIAKDNTVGEIAPELTNTEKIVFRNSKTPEIVANKEIYQVDDTTTVEINTSTSYDGESSSTTVPSWKKYVTIDRKRTSSEEITTEFVEREQKPSEISLTVAEAPLDLTALQQNDDSVSSTDKNIKNTTIENKNIKTEIIVSSPDADDIRLKNITTVDTKRAGFLDLSKLTSSEPNSTTDTNTQMVEQQPSKSKAMTTKNPNVVSESQSQLTEDAINEELLREKMIIDHKENNIRQQKVKQLDYEKPKIEVVPVATEVYAPPTTTEDNLSVQPINQDRKTTLYTISPNYKPMKKIDVQPPKPFVRDPDDNSWRNESISSLGIVFKPKNATKSFKEVLKNKTESEFYNTPEYKDIKELPDLRVRLEKIAEVRKKKKKTSGEIYTDYEESNSGESTTTTTEKIGNMIFHLFSSNSTSKAETTTPMPMPYTKLETTREKMSNDLFRTFIETLTTGKPMKSLKQAAEYYDTTDEYDAEYVTQKIDLKKFPQPYKAKTPSQTIPAISPYTTTPMSRQRLPERKPTVQYFPPRNMKPVKVNIDYYDDNFQKKVNQYTSKEKINYKDFFSVTDLNDPIATDKPTTTPTSQFKYTAYPTDGTTKEIFATSSRLSSPHGFVLNDENFNRGSYVIKHYKDFLNEAAKTSEFDKIPDFVYPDNPEKVNALTTSPLDEGENHARKTTENIYDYGQNQMFRKDVLNRFVDNFNQNSDRFKIDFPILYNNSVIHEKFADSGRVASSSAFMKRLYGHGVGTKPSPISNTHKGCEPNCDMTMELSPAYELHYFVPDQEERQTVEAPATRPSYNYKL